MAGNLSAIQQQRLALLVTMSGKVQQLHGLVERFAVDTTDALIQPMRRSFGSLKRELMGAGFDGMAQQCGAMDMAARRGGSRTMKVRILREGVGTLRHQIEVQQRAVRQNTAGRGSDDEAAESGVKPRPPGAP